MKVINRFSIYLFLVFFLALFLRLFDLTTIPNGFFTDEVVSGYVGRFILQNGHDLYGNLFPLLYFDKFGDYRVILPIYISGISTFIFGVNEFAVRFPPAFLGALVVFPLYWLVNLLFNDKRISLLSAIFIAILPWHITLSRAQSEGIMGLTIFVFALFMCLKSLKENNFKLLILSAVLFFLTYFFYPSFRLLTPLVLIPLPFFATKITKKYAMGLIMGFLILTIFISTTVWGGGRFNQTFILNSVAVAEKIKSENKTNTISLGPNRVINARIFYNKPVEYLREVVNQYFSYYSPNFLFLNGGLPDRYVTPNTGLIFITFALFLLALLIPAKNTKQREYFYLFYLLLIASLPSVITYDDVPNIHRSFFMIIPIVILCALGATRIYDLLPNKIFRIAYATLVIVLMFAEFAYFANAYMYVSPRFRSFQRGDGNREAAQFLIENKNKYNKIYSTTYDDLVVYYLFYTNNFDKNLVGKFKNGTLRVDKIDNIIFVNDQCPFLNQELPAFGTHDLLFAYGDCPNIKNLIEVKNIFRKDNTRAFKVFVK